MKISVITFFVLIASMFSAVYFAPNAHAACGKLLTLPAWYDGLTDGNCELRPVGERPGQITTRTFVSTIIANVIEIILQLIAYFSVGYIIFGGFKYMVAEGDPSKMSAAKMIIRNAIVGLILSTFSIAIVNLVTGIF